MKFRALLIAAMIFPVMAHAGNSLRAECDRMDGDYNENMSIDTINYISNWIGGGPGINVHLLDSDGVGSGWYGQFLNPRSDNFGNAGMGAANVANMAYVDHLTVNICVYGGYFIGIELHNH